MSVTEETRTQIRDTSPGALGRTASLLEASGARRPLLVTDAAMICTPWPNAVSNVIGSDNDSGNWFVGEGMATPRLVESCRQTFADARGDAFVAVGGGAVIDLAKATAVVSAKGGSILDHTAGEIRGPLPPIIAVPTTPGTGAEVSFHAVIAHGTSRVAVRGAALQPDAVVVDVSTWSTAPQHVRAEAVFDAFVHAVEAYLARAATPASDVYARRAIATFARAQDPVEIASACLDAGDAMATANAGLIHALGYALSSRHSIAHGRANALVAVAVLELFQREIPQRCDELARLGGHASIAAAAGDLLERLGLRWGVGAHDVTQDDLEALVSAAFEYGPVVANAPVPVDRAVVRDLFRTALFERRTDVTEVCCGR